MTKTVCMTEKIFQEYINKIAKYRTEISNLIETIDLITKDYWEYNDKFVSPDEMKDYYFNKQQEKSE